MSLSVIGSLAIDTMKGNINSLILLKIHDQHRYRMEKNPVSVDDDSQENNYIIQWLCNKIITQNSLKYS